MRVISVYFFSLLLCLLIAQYGVAQQQDTVRQKVQKPYQNGFAPSAVRIGVAVSDVVNTLTDPQGTYYGFQADLPIRQFMINVDYGQARLKLENNQTERVERNFTYNSQGSFFRAGIDVNLLKDRQTGTNDARGDVIFFGLKYARSQMSDNISFRPATDSATNVIYNITEVSQANNDLVTWWMEMNAGVKVEVFQNIFLGYVLRYKFFKRFSDKNSLTPYEVPGFGNGDKEDAFSFDYYIYYRIPFKK